MDIRAMFNAPDRKKAEEFLQAAVQKMEENLSEGFTVFDFPLEHQRTIRTSNSLERINKEIRRRTKVAGVFPQGSLLASVDFGLTHGDQRRVADREALLWR